MLTFLSFDELAMKTARQKKKYLRKRVRILYLLLNFLVAIFFISSATSLGYIFIITLLVIIGFLTASANLLFKKKAYRLEQCLSYYSPWPAFSTCYLSWRLLTTMEVMQIPK